MNVTSHHAVCCTAHCTTRCRAVALDEATSAAHTSAALAAQVAKFRQKKTRVLITTDVAARGIDIPLLDNVLINGDF